MFRRQSRLCHLFVLNRMKTAILTSYVGVGMAFFINGNVGINFG